MLAHPTSDRLIALGLSGMAGALDDQRRTPACEVMTFEERLGLPVDREAAERDTRRLATRLKFAALRHAASVEGDEDQDLIRRIKSPRNDLRTPRGLDRAVFAHLADGGWIGRAETLLITGATGLGESRIACALGHKACRDDRSVLCHRVPRLFEAPALARGDGRYARTLKSIARAELRSSGKTFHWKVV